MVDLPVDPARASMLQRSRAWLLAHWEAPEAAADELAKFRARQLDAWLRSVPAATLGNIVCVSVIAALLWRNGDHPYLLVWVGSILAVVARTAHAAYELARRPDPARATPAEMARIARLTWILAALYMAYAAPQFIGANPNTRLLLAGILVGLMSNGSLQLSLVPQAALPWVITFSASSCVGLLITGEPVLVAAAVVVLWYGIALSGNVLATSKLFLSSFSSQSEVERQKQVVGLLLNDFESNASDWLWETDAQGRLQHVSNRLAEAVGISVKGLLGRSFIEVMRAPFKRMSREEHQAFLAFETQLGNRVAFRDSVVTVLLDGHSQWWSLTGKPLLGDSGEFRGWRGVGSDITEAHRAELEMHRLANVDALTLVANRHRFQMVLGECFRSIGNPVCTLLLIDLDNFKKVNDTLGHGVGDQLLQQVTARFLAVVDPRDLIARLGGDEFAVVLERELSSTDADAYAHTLLAALREPFVIAGQKIEAGASIGIASAGPDASSASDLLQQSDTALYAAKAAGRRTVRMYDLELDVLAKRKDELARDMPTAIEQGQFYLHYQPQVDADSGALTGFEALVRWQHPVRGTIAPNEFIAIAEETGLIVPLGVWVLRAACQAASDWPLPLRIAVNLSAVQFESPDLLHVVESALADFGLAATRLELELTESALIHDRDRATRLLSALRERQVRIALDDFGTGYSSLAYLRNLPLDKIKIDRSFVCRIDDLEGRDNMLAIVQAIVDLARALQLDTTAEGVETTTQLAELKRMGCRNIQGWLTGRPVDAAAARALVQAQAALLG